MKVNWQIRAPKVRLIDENGKIEGVFERNKAIFFAKNRGYDLALVSENAQPPVAKLIDYGKYKYKQRKSAQKSKKSKNELKEIRLSMKISEHDLGIKINRAEKFLNKGYKVRINLRLKGREMQFQQKASESLEKIIEKLKEKGEVETRPHKERNQFIVQLKPK